MAKRKRTAAEEHHQAHAPRAGGETEAELEEAARDPYAGSEIRTSGGWRLEGGASIRRDLSPTLQRRVISRSDRYYEVNPTYKHCVGLKVDFVVGDGFSVEAAETDVQEVFDRMWDQNGDSLDLQQREWVEADVRYGEVFRTVFHSADGIVTFGEVDPLAVKAVTSSPLNRRALESVVLFGGSGRKDLEVPVIRRDPRVAPTPEAPLGSWGPAFEAVGDVAASGVVGIFPFLTGRMSGGTRGRPHFLSAFDAFDRGRDLLTVALDREKLLNHFVWKVLIKATGNEYTDLERKILAAGPPRPLSLLIHNEKVDWSVVGPDVSSPNMEVLYRLNRQQVSDGTGFPPFRLNDGNTTNAQATAVEMADGETRMLTACQSLWIARFRGLCDYQLFVARSAGKLQRFKDPAALAYELKFDPVRDNDQSAELDVLQKVTDLLDQAERGKKLTLAEGRDIWRAAARALSWEVPDEIPVELTTGTAGADPKRAATLAAAARDKIGAALAKAKAGDPAPADAAPADAQAAA